MFCGINTVSAQTSGLVVGVTAGITDMDPHFHMHVSVQNLVKHVFEKLITRDALFQILSALATSWCAGLFDVQIQAKTGG